MPFSLDFFDALRRMKARPKCTVPAIVVKSPATAGPANPRPAIRQIGPAGIVLVKRFEGCARKRTDGCFGAYPDPGSGGHPWTIGWGATGAGIVQGLVWTQQQCDERLASDLARYAAEVSAAIGTSPTSAAQFDAMVSFHYNTGAIRRATLTKLHRAGDHAAASREFGKWVQAGGRRLPGLVRRRAAEAELYNR
ncbi:lysozyme [Novosphingobium sp.]|uniref:lysozyme n=1 Tax=Novosphingobium sp. TaxID=1874826 RepID=UPI0025D8214D|nr:lysozyme [Novosphingobium sp.]